MSLDASGPMKAPSSRSNPTDLRYDFLRGVYPAWKDQILRFAQDDQSGTQGDKKELFADLAEDIILFSHIMTL